MTAQLSQRHLDGSRGGGPTSICEEVARTSTATPFAGKAAPRIALHAVRYVFALARLLYLSLSSIVWERRHGAAVVNRLMLQQVYFTAVQALPLTLFVAVAFGGLVMIQASIQLPRFGMREVEKITGLVLFRELAPLVVALIVIARSANAIVVEVGNMRVNGEMRALEVMGINIERFIVLPRVIGVVTSVLLLAVSFCAAAYWGGFWMATFSGYLESNFVLARLTAVFDLALIRNLIVRCFAFGIVIALVACHHGLRVEFSPTEVPQQATRGVISALSLSFVINFAVSLGV
jgi:phospholipid/cholesterol/gamma-HCH transport system permease protein